MNWYLILNYEMWFFMYLYLSLCSQKESSNSQNQTSKFRITLKETKTDFSFDYALNSWKIAFSINSIFFTACKCKITYKGAVSGSNFNMESFLLPTFHTICKSQLVLDVQVCKRRNLIIPTLTLTIKQIYVL